MYIYIYIYIYIYMHVSALLYLNKKARFDQERMNH